MKTFISIFIIFLFNSISFSQVSNFDSSYVVVSSPQYDFKNPKTENKYSSGLGFQQSWLAYEKQSASTSNIAVKLMTYSGYGSEIMITNDTNVMNVNPSHSNNFLVWQSNKYGNWDLFFSQFNGSNWSAPVRLDSTAANEIVPFIQYNNTEPSGSSYYYLTFIRDNDICFKTYKVTFGYWGADTNLTTEINEPCLNPIIYYSGSTGCICFLRHVNDSTNKLVYKNFTQVANQNYQTWQPSVEKYFPKTVNNLGWSFVYNLYLTFEYDTLNAVQTIGVTPPSSNSREVFTFIPGGKNTQGKGTLMGMITDYVYFSGFAFVRKSNDSTIIYASSRYNPLAFNTYKRFYVGNYITDTKLAISPSIYNTNYYKIRAIWEKKINNKSALVESYCVDFLNPVNNNDIYAASYNLTQNYPNPFNPSTNIKYQISKNSFVTLKVYDILGKEVATLVNENLQAGTYETQFSINSITNNRTPSGIYFYKLSAGYFSEIKKMILIK